MTHDFKTAFLDSLLQPFIEESKPRPEEYELIRGVFERYTAGVMPTATKLVWAGVGYSVWIPLVLFQRLMGRP